MILIIQSLDKDAIKIQNKKYGEKKYMYISTELTSEKKNMRNDPPKTLSSTGGAYVEQKM